MPVEVTAAVMADTAGMLLKDMPPQVMLKVYTLVSVHAVVVVTNLRGPRAAMPDSQGAHVIGLEAVTGEAVTGEAGEAVTGIRPMDILGSAITVRAMAIHTTAMAIRTTGVATTD